MFSRLASTVCIAASLLSSLASANPLPDPVSPRQAEDGVTMKNFGYFWRGVTDKNEALNKQFPPPSAYSNPGDFAPKGHLGMYFWSNQEDAEDWCTDHYPGQECYAVEYEWAPPSPVAISVYSFPYTGNVDYTPFVKHNWNSPEPDGSWTKYDVIEGPLSAAAYQPSEVLYQYCIVHQQAIMYLTQVGVHRVQKREVKTAKRAAKIKSMQQVPRSP
ncbi:hypothetical protein Hte_011162 [Hypoxylon texense]